MEGLADRLVAAALEMVEAAGWAGVTLRQVASAAGVTYGAPIARFGDSQGLLAAVAERGFRLLVMELASPPPSAPPPQPSAPLRASAVNSLGLRYVEFALRHRNLHRAMHHPDLQAPGPPRDAPSPSIARRQARSAAWRKQADAARHAVFARFVAAVVEGQVAGEVADGPPGELARVITALADGLILQTTDGPADRRPDWLPRQLAAAERLFGWAMTGIARRPSPAAY